MIYNEKLQIKATEHASKLYGGGLYEPIRDFKAGAEYGYQLAQEEIKTLQDKLDDYEATKVAYKHLLQKQDRA